MEYSSEVQRRFRAPRWSGSLSERGTGFFAGEAADRSLNVWVRFQVQADTDSIRAVRFEAYGCPHFVAAADWMAEWLEGKPSDVLTQPHAHTVGKLLDVPTEKLGKLLVLEDALTRCAPTARPGVRA
jgi:NifU-like protein involved in Fe-S cluster formation